MRMAIIYFIMGALFLYLAFIRIEDTIWNTTTILLTLVAAVDFGVGYRYMRIHFQNKQNENKN